jgi:hypothetical protein
MNACASDTETQARTHAEARNEPDCEEAKYQDLRLDACHAFLTQITISPMTFKVYNHPTNLA